LRKERKNFDEIKRSKNFTDAGWENKQSFTHELKLAFLQRSVEALGGNEFDIV
jgi:hypothetical protein